MYKLLTVFLLLSASTSAQKLVGSFYLEHTHISPKVGISAGILLTNAIEGGLLFQKHSEMISSNESSMPRFYEKEFIGAYFSYPVKQFRLVDFAFKVRTGVTNRRNFLITPSIHGFYTLGQKIRFGLGIGSRAFRPTAQSSVAVIF